MSKLIDVKRYTAGIRSRQLERELVGIQREMQEDVKRIIKELDKLPKAFTQRRRRSALRKAAKEFVTTCQGFVRDSKFEHVRYDENGTPIAFYLPGNLRKSIQVMTFRQSKSAVYVGPKATRKKRLVYGDSAKTTDPYYAHMVEFGTKHMPPQGYMRKGFSAGRMQANAVLKKEVKKIFERYAKSIKKNKNNGR